MKEDDATGATEDESDSDIEYSFTENCESVINDVAEIQETLMTSVYPALEEAFSDLDQFPELANRTRPWLRRVENLHEKLDSFKEAMAELARMYDEGGPVLEAAEEASIH